MFNWKQNIQNTLPTFPDVPYTTHIISFMLSVGLPCWQPSINNILRWAKWIVFVIELNLLLSCFGLSALYLSTTDPARRPGITPPPYTICTCLLSSSLVKFSAKTRCPFPLFLSKHVIYLCSLANS